MKTDVQCPKCHTVNDLLDTSALSKFFLECYWFVTMNVENMLPLRHEDCFTLRWFSDWQENFIEVCTHAHLIPLKNCWAMWRLNLDAYSFVPDFLSTLCSLDYPSVSLVYFKKFWHPDSRIIILRVYQFSLYPFREFKHLQTITYCSFSTTKK